jgi:hypothetical protein
MRLADEIEYGQAILPGVQTQPTAELLKQGRTGTVPGTAECREVYSTNRIREAAKKLGIGILSENSGYSRRPGRGSGSGSGR